MRITAAVIAVQLADLVWPVLVLAGIERFEIRPGITAFTPLDFVHYPWSHSLVALAVWGVAFGAAHAVEFVLDDVKKPPVEAFDQGQRVEIECFGVVGSRVRRLVAGRCLF